MSLIIAGERSGVGKTTITLALLAFLAKKNYKVQSFKVGPDYIDPMFHTAITHLPCRNLDPILTSESYVKSCFKNHSQNSDYALIEGVMGLFDGVPFPNNHNPHELNHFNHYGSTAHIAKLLDLPVLLVIDCSKLSGSVAAIATGYQNLDPRVKIVGVFLNKVGSDRHLTLLKQALKPLNLEIFGVLYRNQEIKIPDRHLGLIPTQEISEIKQIFDQLAQLAQHSFNWSKLLPLLKTQKSTTLQDRKIENKLSTFQGEVKQLKKIRIAVAYDSAFNFYYQDNFDILENLGAEIYFWSPLKDTNLPENIQGIYLGGGFPEVFAAQLSHNKKASSSLKKAILKGIPTYAECGGLMYLSEGIKDFKGNLWEMVGILPAHSIMTSKLTLGYRQVISLQDNIFSTKNTIIWGHEFHRSQMSNFPDNPLLRLKNCYSDEICSYQGWKIHQVYASYIHLHFATCQPQLIRFLSHCLKINTDIKKSNL